MTFEDRRNEEAGRVLKIALLFPDNDCIACLTHSCREFSRSMQAFKLETMESDPGLLAAWTERQETDPDISWLDVAAEREELGLNLRAPSVPRAVRLGGRMAFLHKDVEVVDEFVDSPLLPGQHRPATANKEI